MKFKVGDRVKVSTRNSFFARKGAVGLVQKISKDGCFFVKFKDGDPLVEKHPSCSWSWYFDCDELQAVDSNHSPDSGKMVRPSPAEDGSTTERLVDQIRARHHAGLKKYGVTVDRNDLEPLQWVQHFREELLDALAYLQRIEDKLNNK